jgi:ribosomal protein L16/L10AE
MRQLGKEDLLVKIALKFQEWISVPLAMYRTAEILGLQDVFCVDDMDCQIRIVPFHTVTRSSGEDRINQNGQPIYQIFLPFFSH